MHIHYRLVGVISPEQAPVPPSLAASGLSNHARIWPDVGQAWIASKPCSKFRELSLDFIACQSSVSLAWHGMFRKWRIAIRQAKSFLSLRHGTQIWPNHPTSRTIRLQDTASMYVGCLFGPASAGPTCAVHSCVFGSHRPP